MPRLYQECNNLAGGESRTSVEWVTAHHRGVSATTIFFVAEEMDPAHGLCACVKGDKNGLTVALPIR